MKTAQPQYNFKLATKSCVVDSCIQWACSLYSSESKLCDKERLVGRLYKQHLNDVSRKHYASWFVLTLPQAIGLNAHTSSLWEQLFADFSRFEDLRASKAIKGGKGPDFRHIASGEGLW